MDGFDIGSGYIQQVLGRHSLELTVEEITIPNKGKGLLFFLLFFNDE